MQNDQLDMCAKKKKMIYDSDEWLMPYKEVIDKRHQMILDTRDRLSVDGSLAKGMNNHIYYGLHRDNDGNWVFREWAPNATKI
jgi:1,4-alpha-glucan branching enzyme